MKRLAFLILFLGSVVFAHAQLGGVASIRGYKGEVFAYVSTPAGTTTTDAGTYYYMASTFTNETATEFAFVSDTLQYQGTSGLGLIMIAGTFRSDTPNTEITLAVKVNGAIVTHTEMTAEANATTDKVAIPVLDIHQINKGDNISIWIKSDKAGAVVTPVTFTTGIIML